MNKTADLQVCSRQYLKYLKEYYLTNLQNFQISFFFFILYGFREGYSTQYVTCFKNWKNKPDRIVGTLLIDLSKTCDCVNHELIIAKLAANGLNEGSLRSIQNYL